MASQPHLTERWPWETLRFDATCVQLFYSLNPCMFTHNKQLPFFYMQFYLSQQFNSLSLFFSDIIGKRSQSIMTLKDGTHTISSILHTSPVLDLAGPNPFANPFAGVICLSVLLKPRFLLDMYSNMSSTKRTINPQSQQWQVNTLCPGVYGLQSYIGPCWITAP